MINILLVAATFGEIAPFVEALNLTKKKGQVFYELQYGQFQINLLITGVGMVHTAFHLGRLLLQKNYDLALNIGIAGSFNTELRIGQIVRVQSQIFGDMGAEGKDTFIPLKNMDFFDENQFPYQDGKLFSPTQTLFPKLQNLVQVSASSVNKVLGSESSIRQTKKMFGVDIESMEGAAFFYSCLMAQQAFVELRAISNYVEVRNKLSWNIPLAVKNLNQLLLEIVEA